MKIQFDRIDTNVVVGLLVREFCCSGTDMPAKVLEMYAGTRTPSMEPQWLAAGLSQRDAMPLEQCFSIIENGSGQDFDPYITDVFLDMKEMITNIVENN